MQGPATLTSTAEQNKEPSHGGRVSPHPCLRSQEVSCARQIAWPGCTEITELGSQLPGPMCSELKAEVQPGRCPGKRSRARPPPIIRHLCAKWEKAPLPLGSGTPGPPSFLGQAPPVHIRVHLCVPARWLFPPLLAPPGEQRLCLSRLGTGSPAT